MRKTIPETRLKFAASARQPRVLLAMALVFLLSSSVLQNLVLATSGDLDATFGSGGRVTAAFPGANDAIRGTVLQSDGKIVVAGSDGNDFTLARYNTDGSLDTGFGSGGKVATDFFGGVDQAFAVVIDSTGRIIAGGSATKTTGSNTNTDFGLARYNTNGILDTTFGVGGKATTDFFVNNDQVSALAIDSMGRIVAAGRAFNPGNPPSTPGTNFDFALARYNSDGTLDTTFDTDGKVTTDFAGDADQAFAVAIQTDGKIVAAGVAANGATGNDFALARYNANGSLDTGFDTDGKVTTDFSSNGDDRISAIAIQSDGRVVAAGRTASSNPSGVGLATPSSVGAGGTSLLTVTVKPGGNPPSTGINVTADLSSIGGSATQQFFDDGTHGDAVAGDKIFSFSATVAAGTTAGTKSLKATITDAQSRSAIAVISLTETVAMMSAPSEQAVTDSEAPISVPPPGDQSGSDPPAISASSTMTAAATPTGNDFALARYNSDGGLDMTFGTGGQVTTDFNGGTDQAFALALQPADGKLIAAGVAFNGATGNDFALARYSATGTLDTTFDTDGKVTTDFSGGSDQALAVAFHASDGKIIAAGAAFNGIGGNDFSLARYTSTGALDTTFDTDGKVTTDFPGGSDAARALAIQSDGKIIVVGNNNNDFALTRLNSNGSVDTAFGTSGQVITDFFNGTDQAFAVAIQPGDGKIVVAGVASSSSTGSDFALARYNTDGTLDTTFDTDGKVTTPVSAGADPDQAFAVAVQSDGKIVAAGFANSSTHGNDFALVRYNADGSLDSAFGTAGIVTTDFSGRADQAFAVAIQTDGKIVAAGSANNGATGNDFAIARYTSGGVLDMSYGTGGKVTTDFAGGADQALAVAIQASGKVIAVGRAAITSTRNDFALARYNTLGNLDPTFGTNGKANTSFSGGDDRGLAIALQSHGKFAVAGVAANAGTANDFAVARYFYDGTLDSGFGTGGKVTTDFSGGDDQASAVAFQTDGKIVAAGRAFNNGTNFDFAIARYLGDAGTSDVDGDGVADDLDNCMRTSNPSQADVDGNGIGDACDNRAPVAVCQNVTKSAGSTCQASVTASEVNNGSSDPDGDPMTFSLSPAGPYALGITAVTLTVTDHPSDPARPSRSSACTATITVVDTTGPTVTCPASFTVSTDSGCQGSIPDILSSVTASDNCTPSLALSKSQSPAAGTLANVGPQTVTVTVTDAAGNSNTCTTTVTIADNLPPTITTCPAGQAVPAGAGCQGTIPNVLPDVVATDNCTPTASLVKTQSPSAGTVVNVGSHPITVTVTDASSNSSTCTVPFSVVQSSAPAITTCPPPRTLAVNGSCQGIIPNVLGEVVATDSCTPSGSLVKSQNPAAGTVLNNPGTYTITITVTNASGFSSTCTTTVTFVDTTAPVITCPGNITVTAAPGKRSAIVYYTVTATDNCSPVSVTCTPASGSSFPIGTTSVSCTTKDPANNSASCSFTVTVQKK